MLYVLLPKMQGFVTFPLPKCASFLPLYPTSYTFNYNIADVPYLQGRLVVPGRVLINRSDPQAL
jgi:hypothetical protein